MQKNIVAIINRGFWPASDVPGASLLALAEELSKDCDTFVLTQSNLEIQKICRAEGKAEFVQIRSCKSLTDSNSKIHSRIFETIFFATWIVLNLYRIRPGYIYIATDPPLVLPFIVSIYSKIFNAKYTYHLQDIHPEASKNIIKMPLCIYNLLISMDNFTLKNAQGIVTLTNEMAEYICAERKISNPIYLIENASIYPRKNLFRVPNTIIFAGNAGRLQEIPLLVAAIDLYLKQGGILKFTFMGSGIYSHLFKEISDRWENAEYLGYLPLDEAIEVLSQHEWALIPINDQVLNYAFPSKTSAYISAGCKIFAICSNNSSLSRWVKSNGFGIVSSPIIESIVDNFRCIENGGGGGRYKINIDQRSRFSFELFSSNLKTIILK